MTRVILITLCWASACVYEPGALVVRPGDGDSASASDGFTGDHSLGDPSTGDSSTGDSAAGDATTGDATTGDASGDPTAAGDPGPVVVSCPGLPGVSIYDGTMPELSDDITSDGTHAFRWQNNPLSAPELEAHWHFDGSGAVANDESLDDTVADRGLVAHDYNSSLSYVPAHVNEGIELDGVDDWLDGGDVLAMNGPLTVMAWVKAYRGGAGASGVIAGRMQNYELSFENSQAVMRVWATSCSQSYAIQSPNLPTGEWYHLAGVFTGSTNQIYVNGQLQETQVIGSTIGLCNMASSLLVGASTGATRLFQGVIDEVTVWSKQLASENIADIYRAQAPRYFGTFISEACDGGEDLVWTDFAPVPAHPAHKPLRPLAETDYPQDNLDARDLIGLWHMDGSGPISNLSTINDSSTYDNHADVATSGSPPEYRRGKLAEGVYLDGDDTITVANSSSLTSLTAMTAMAWIRQEPGVSRSETVIAMPGAWALFVRDDRSIGFTGDFNINLLEVASTDLIAPAIWTHVAVTWSVGSPGAADTKLFVNGAHQTQAFEQDGSGLATSSTGRSIVIGTATGGHSGFDGQLDQVALFNRQLTAGQIAAVYRRATVRISYQVATCTSPECPAGTFVGPDNTPNTAFSELTNHTASPVSFRLVGLPVRRYFRFRATLETDITTVLPKLTGYSTGATRAP